MAGIQKSVKFATYPIGRSTLTETVGKGWGLYVEIKVPEATLEFEREGNGIKCEMLVPPILVWVNKESKDEPNWRHVRSFMYHSMVFIFASFGSRATEFAS